MKVMRRISNGKKQTKKAINKVKRVVKKVVRVAKKKLKAKNVKR